MALDVIAVALDFSADSLTALRLARACLHSQGSLRLIHVIDDTITWAGRNGADGGLVEYPYADLIRGARLTLDGFAEELRAVGLKVESVVEVGRPADRILAASRGASLLVLGRQGHGTLARIFLGSVAEEVSRLSPIPTLLVRQGTNESQIERVLVAIDPSERAGDSIRAAAAVADRLGARLEAIHAAHAPSELPYAPPGAMKRLGEIVTSQLESAPTLVRGLFRKAIGRDVVVHVFTGPPATEILRQVGPHDLLVCGTHARSAFGRLVFGSVATKLLRNAPCPVLVVRPSDDEAAS